MARTILIDDTDPGITYSGPWFLDYGSQDSLGNFGLPYQHTLHGTTSDTCFAYTFQGTTIEITGTQQYQNTSAVTNPSWECIVDGKTIEVQTYSYANNRLVLCSLSNITDGTHTIVVNVHVTDNRTFWFDFLTYQPSASVPLDQAAISVEVPEPDMHFGTGWEPFATGYKTSLTGSIFTFDFNGRSLTWYGSYDAQFPFAATTARYTVDGGSPVIFDLNGVAATQTAVQYNQLFFTTPTYPPGLHTLEVSYQGNNETTPLALEFIIIQNGTLATMLSSTGSSPSATSASGTHLPTSSASSISTHSASLVGPIVGAVIGGLTLIIGAILLFLYLHRRERRFQLPEAEEVMRTTDQELITPYSLDVGFRPPSISKNRANPVSGNPVVGKRNIAANAARAVDNPSASANTSNTTGLDTLYASDPATTSRSRPVRQPSAMDKHNPSSSTANISDSPLNPIGATSSASRPQQGSGSFPLSVNFVPEGTNSPRIIRDEDSGIRMRQTDEGDVVVLPPLYTAS